MRILPITGCLLIGICIIHQSLAQSDFHPFPEMAVRFYSGDSTYYNTGRIYAIAPQILAVVDDTIQIVSFPSITLSLDLFDLGVCYTDDVGWPFRRLDIWPDGRLAFSTHSAIFDGIETGISPVLIDPFAPVGSTWIAYASSLLQMDVMAEVTDYDTMRVLGQLDSVKTITFSANGSDAFDNLIFRIGKATGIIKMPGFLQFDQQELSYWHNAYEESKTWVLRGISTSENGVRNLTMLEVYNFEVGDVLHIFHYDGGSTYATDDDDSQEEKWEVMERTDLGDSIVYHVHIDAKSIEHSAGDSTITYSSRVDTLSYTANPDFDQLPGSIIPDHWSVNDVAYNYQRTWNGRDVKIRNIEILYSSISTTCYFPAIVEGCTPELIHIRGLGGRYFSCIQFFTGARFSKELRYYKKGDEEWGEPFDFTVRVSDIAETTNVLQVAPNPAADFVRIKTDVSSDLDIRIIDMHGVTRIVRQGLSPITLSTVNLLPGIYFLVVNSERTLSTKKLVIR